MKEKPNLSFWGLWNLSFGFFGVQIAYALQSANISRIFATLGADPHSLSYFWILPPLMGIIVQPIVGTCSDKTWCRFGRRIPYLFIGAAIAVLVMCLLPNSGSFGMTVSTAMTFGLIALMFLDTSINMAMQPFKMLVGDMVNEKQKAAAYSIQSFLCNAGSLVGYVFPFVFALLGIANTAPKGVVPDSVIYSFYVGAAILILCVIYTVAKVKEWNPKEYEEYNGVKEDVKEEDLIMLHELESNLVYFATSLRANGAVIDRLSRYSRVRQFPEDKDLLDDVKVENGQAIEMTVIYRDIIHGTRELLSNMIDIRLNNVMKYLAAITIVMAIPNIISGFYGMNVSAKWVPLVGTPFGFGIICVATFVVCLIVLKVLKKKKML